MNQKGNLTNGATQAASHMKVEREFPKGIENR